jgi:8-oxo-dGTP pyrophosphatase MutT (NUDIX family)
VSNLLEEETSRADYILSIAQLLGRYLSNLPTEAERMPVLLEQLERNDYRLTNRKNMVGHLTASALVINHSSQVLLIHHNGLKRWLQPGGHLNHNEEPESGARRELLEETGLGGQGEITLVHSPHSSKDNLLPFDVDTHHIPANPSKSEGEHKHHDFQYIYQLDPKNAQPIVLQEEEVAKYKWVSFDQLASGEYGKRLSRVAEKLRASQNSLGIPRH